MDIRLTQNQSQKLVLSPQVQQYLKLLQLPVLELSQTVENELLENPVLELDVPDSDQNDPQNDQEAPETPDQSELDFQQQFDILEKLDDNFKESYKLNSSETDFESIENLEKKHQFQESILTKEETIVDYLEWQLGFYDLSELDTNIALEIIGAIDSDGYFKQDLDDFAAQFKVSDEKITEIFQFLQGFDPAGVFGRNLQEVLILQIERKGATEVAKLALRILEEAFDLFEKRESEAIAKKFKIPIETVKLALQLITSLDPKPGRTFQQTESQTIVPDATIHPPLEFGGDYRIDIHDEHVPRLRISSYYRKLIKDKNIDAKTRDYIKQKVNAGFWFLKAMEQRKSTLRLITEEIVKAQRDFFEKGFSFLKPLTLKEIAVEINIHESTVSRALSGKYVETPQGVIPYKSFFSNRMATIEGEDESQTSVMEKMKKIIEQENPKKPLSDAKIVKLLQDEEGIKIARRTVAKYRELLKILPSHLRKTK